MGRSGCAGPGPIPGSRPWVLPPASGDGRGAPLGCGQDGVWTLTKTIMAMFENGVARQPCSPCHSRLTGGIRRNLVRGAVDPSLPTARTHYTRPCEMSFLSQYIKPEVSCLTTSDPGRNPGETIR